MLAEMRSAFGKRENCEPASKSCAWAKKKRSTGRSPCDGLANLPVPPRFQGSGWKENRFQPWE
ncbi:MAG: hypothetical protein JWN42_2010 [Candidatus Angelobacter sp.]|nr:hypothetical protein [Candidatus Angelobacter sp.]